MVPVLKKLLQLYFGLFLLFSASAQKIISLKPDKIVIPDRTFFVASIIDGRKDPSSIGTTTGNETLSFETNTASYLLEYFNKTLPQEYKKQQPVYITIKKFVVSEENKYSEIASVAISLDFYIDMDGTLGKVFEAKSEVNESGVSISASHDKRIKFALYDCLKQFAEADWKSANKVYKPNESSKFENPPTKVKETKEDNDIDLLKPKNMKSIGLLLGGFCFIGYEYEWRVHDYIGINMGIGLIGATAGLKIHTKPNKDSHFFNISVKDFGFGTMDAAAVEWGGRWVFRKGKNLGLIYQFGYSYVVNINAEFKKLVYGDTQDLGGLIFGIGLSW